MKKRVELTLFTTGALKDLALAKFAMNNEFSIDVKDRFPADSGSKSRIGTHLPRGKISMGTTQD